MDKYYNAALSKAFNSADVYLSFFIFGYGVLLVLLVKYRLVLLQKFHIMLLGRVTLPCYTRLFILQLGTRVRVA